MDLGCGRARKIEYDETSAARNIGNQVAAVGASSRKELLSDWVRRKVHDVSHRGNTF